MDIQVAQEQFDEALEHARTLKSRNADKSTMDAALAKASALKSRLERLRGDANMTAALEEITGGMTAPSRGRLSSMGQQFIESDVMRWLRDSKNSRSAIFSSPTAELMAATVTEDAASAGDLVVTDYQQGVVRLATRKLAMADLFASTQTPSGSVTYMKETGFTNAANTVAEGTTKPESTLTYDAVVDPVRKIAHWIPATNEVLEDVPGMRAYIDTRLRDGLELELDDQLLNGTTTPPDIVGVLNRTELAADQARGADTNVDAIGKQIAAITTATNIPPDGIVLHPTNWLTIQLMKDTAGSYMANGGPFSAQQRATLWGLPVATTTAIALNTALVGSFKGAARVFYNGGVRVDVSNSHSDFFVKNLVALRGERRAALAIYVPSAFGKVTGLV